MICLGIESTAHTFGVGIIKDKKVLSNVWSSYRPEKGGIHPREAAEHHFLKANEVINLALEKAGISKNDLNLIAFSKGPGIGTCLRVGAVVARILSESLNIPIVGVNHCVAHLEIGKLLTGTKDPVLLYVSGGNTQVIAFEGGRYRVFGETLDIGIGNLLDAFARYVGIPFPGGPEIEKLAKGGKYIDLPYSVKGMDVSFGGLLSNLKQKSKNYELQDLSYSLQETSFSMLIEVAERAMAHCNKKELLLAGGVAANKRLREMSEIMCNERGGKLFVPEIQFCIDNGAMIAWLGILMKDKPDAGPVMQDWRTDQVEVFWK